jgi:hypothetical protein
VFVEPPVRGAPAFGSLGTEPVAEILAQERVGIYHEALRPAEGSSGRVQTETEITRALPQRVRALRRIADPVYTRWLEGFGERPESK